MHENDTTTESARRDWLAALLLRRPERLMPRFVAALTRLRALPRGYRRRLQRKAALSAAGAALILALAGSPLLVPTAHAAVITVDGVTCTLVDAITAANTNTVAGGCIAGDSGLDTIDLQTDVTLTASYGSYYGSDTGLPQVTSEIVIEGNGHTVERDGAAPNFRILAVHSTGDLTINDLTIEGGHSSGYSHGGAILNVGDLTINNSTFSNNHAGENGGAVAHFGGTATITGSTFSGNTANFYGGAIGNAATMSITNSTISGNSAFKGGGILAGGTLTINNSTITGNTVTGSFGGGIYNSGATTLVRSIVSGNSAPSASREIDDFWGSLTIDEYDLFGFNGDDGIYFSVPGASDIVPGAGVTIAHILDTTLADNGGPTDTHNLVAGSPALDVAPDADCAAAPVSGLDQRGFARPVDVPGEGNDAPSTDTCDIGAVEYGSSIPGDAAVFMSTHTAGTTDDGLAFGPHDILQWDGTEWSKFFDGSAAGLMPSGNAKHDINAFFVEPPTTDFILLSFTQNARIVPGIFDKVDGMDAVTWNGSYFQLVFDGQDVGLTNKTQEKIDALHLLDGAAAPPELITAAGGSCQVYMLVSTAGPGKVPNYSGGTLSFSGEDVLGFCFTSNGDNTAGKWIKVRDGSDQGMPKNSTDSISLSADGNVLYLTTKGTCNVETATGGHSMVYGYDLVNEEFFGPLFVAADEGLTQKVDGLQVEGDLP